jgi:hypothetical protein
VKAVRIAAFVCALGAFVCQIAVAHDAGVSALDALVVVLATSAGLAAGAAMVVQVSLRRQRRRLAALTASRPGWVGVRSIVALAAGMPAGAPRSPGTRCALLFGPQGVELWTGKRAPYRLLFSAPWAEISVSAARVSYVSGRGVVKAGLRLTPAGRPAQHFTVSPERPLRAQFPAPTGAECVVAAMTAAQRPFGVEAHRRSSDIR